MLGRPAPQVSAPVRYAVKRRSLADRRVGSDGLYLPDGLMTSEPGLPL
jgi:hypothetical protein